MDKKTLLEKAWMSINLNYASAKVNKKEGNEIKSFVYLEIAIAKVMMLEDMGLMTEEEMNETLKKMREGYKLCDQQDLTLHKTHDT